MIDANRDAILKILTQKSVDGQPQPGLWVPLVRLRRIDGSATEIHVVEGSMQEHDIEGRREWAPLLGRDSVLVNSVDEMRSGAGGISAMIATGCGVRPQKQTVLNLGDAPLEECIGDYSRLGFRKVANAAVVIWRGRKEQPPCWERKGPDYQLCLQNAVSTSLSRMFAQIQRERHQYEAILIPALGTGTGGMDVAAFYKLAADALEQRLTDERPYFLPRKVVFLVWRDDEHWEATADGIATNIAELAQRWGEKTKYADVSNDAIRSGVGLAVAGCLFIMVLIPSSSIALSAVSLTRIGAIPMVIGWIASALGFATSAKSILSGSYSSSEVWPFFVLGSVCVVTYSFLAQSVKAFKALPDEAGDPGKDTSAAAGRT